jgi:NodT family efflux transporter outer membrane factor (OMF) lipoprotein
VKSFAPSALAALAILGGCTLGPRYAPPALPPGAAAPLVSLSPGAETPAQPPTDWWRLYDDTRLDGLIAQAFAANNDLKAAQANLSAARAMLEATRAGAYPSTVTEAGAIHGRDPTADEILELQGAKPQTFWLYDGLLDVSYELDLFGRVRRSIEASRADAQAVAANRDAVRITVAAETARAYAQVCTLGEELAVAEQSLTIADNQERILERRHTAGANTEFDVVRAQQLVAQVRSSIPPLQGQRRAALFELAALTGRTPSQAPGEVEACVTPPHLVSLIPVGDGAALLKRRPDVRLADRRVAAATARVGVAMADLYPRITLTGFYGGAAPTIGELTQNAGLAWGVGPKISWAFPNQAAPRARVRQARATAEVALDQFDSTVLDALKETEQALTAYGAELDGHQALLVAQERAARAFEIARSELLAGGIATLDLLTSQQTLIAADANLAASDAALVQDQIAVFKALGGGWQSTGAPPQTAGTLPPSSAQASAPR